MDIGLVWQAYQKKFDAEGIRRLIYDAWKVQGVITIHDGNSEENIIHLYRLRFQKVL